jgi:tRNA U34 5-methylaminomethyl-2-thiouridine-forming methyltransferase MnmC
LEKRLSDLTCLDGLRTDELFDLIYFDAFAPDKQPEMWTQAIFNYLYEHTTTDGILTTYCAKGGVRRMLQSAGYMVERLPGPPGKREMLRARKNLETVS